MTKLSMVPLVQLPIAASQTATLFGAGPPGAMRPSQAADPAKTAKAAQDFESMAIGQLLQPMFDTVTPEKDGFGGGAGEEAWKPLLVQEFAKQISNHGGLGLAKPVYDAMLRMQQAAPK
jgi:flagellar protein FlgJ